VEAVLIGEIDAADFRDNPGIIEAEILEGRRAHPHAQGLREARPVRGRTLKPPGFLRKMERLAFGRDFECVDDCNVHAHGRNSISSGRGTFLIVDITNRCNMMCSPCFMDANAASYVHELSMEDIKVISATHSRLSLSGKSTFCSQREPTVSPIFLDAVRTRKRWLHRLHVATNGIEFAKSKDFALQARKLACTVSTSNWMESPKKRTNIADWAITSR